MFKNNLVSFIFKSKNNAGLRTIVNAICNSMKPLGEVMLIMIFLLVIIALIALQAYQGVLRRRCVKVPQNSSLDWQAYATNQSLCIFVTVYCLRLCK